MTIETDRLLSVEEARKGVIDAIAGPVGSETIATADGLDRVLAEPVVAVVSLPPWDNSAMDGYAIRAADVQGATEDAPTTLEVIGEVRAGQAPDQAVRRGELEDDLVVVDLFHRHRFAAGSEPGGRGGGGGGFRDWRPLRIVLRAHALGSCAAPHGRGGAAHSA